MAPIEGKQSHVTVNTLMVLRKKFQSDNAYKEINETNVNNSKWSIYSYEVSLPST